MGPGEWCWMNRAGRCRNSWPGGGAPECCWRCAARTTRKMWWTRSPNIRRCRCGCPISRRGNWEPKSANLASLAEELDFGLDSFILVDDSAKECTEAQAGNPEVLALTLPAQAEEIPEFLKHVWAFDQARVTEEDRRRPEWYAQRAERTRAAKASASLEEFLASLQLEIAIGAMEPGQLERVAQLTRRTNQMNASCVRRSEAEIQALIATGGASGQGECLTVNVKDRFGSYGLTGVILFRCQEAALVADTFLLS